VFSQLHEKGLVYRGVKVMPFSTGCATPLSNFEAGLDYRDVDDPSGIFKINIKNLLLGFFA
jgi:isoleucyl-tRNA synthetase